MLLMSISHSLIFEVAYDMLNTSVQPQFLTPQMNLSSLVLLTTIHRRTCVRAGVLRGLIEMVFDNIPCASIVAADCGDVRRVSIVYFVVRAELQVSALECRSTLTKCGCSL